MSGENDKDHKGAQLVAPLRFGCVEPNLYRGNYPRVHNLQFLRQLGLKSILSLIPDHLEPEIQNFADNEGITVIRLPTEESSSKSKKKRQVPVTPAMINKALALMLDSELQPMYVHCINGSQVTSLLIGCLRKVSFWSKSAILDEFVRYSELGNTDQLFLDSFHAHFRQPSKPVPWLWNGLSDKVVSNHPSCTLILEDDDGIDEDDPALEV